MHKIGIAEKLIRETAVQVSDTTMLKKDLWAVTKEKRRIHHLLIKDNNQN